MLKSTGQVPFGIKHESEFDYFVFEDRYRATKRTPVAVPKSTWNSRRRENVVDIGCGQGELLELLCDSHFSAKGVEPTTD
jgi:hypothetical protein